MSDIIKDIYEEVRKLGIEIDHHESDLYIPVTIETTALVSKYQFKESVTTFVSQIDGTLWYEIPFAYQPFWDRVRDSCLKSQV